MLDHLEAHDEVEALAERRQPHQVERAEGEPLVAVARRRDRDRLFAIDGEHPLGVRREQRGAVALAAPGVEHALPRRQPGREAIGRQVAFHVDAELDVAAAR